MKQNAGVPTLRSSVEGPACLWAGWNSCDPAWEGTISQCCTGHLLTSLVCLKGEQSAGCSHREGYSSREATRSAMGVGTKAGRQAAMEALT